MAAPQIINIGGTAYISASDAARMIGLSQSYITRLARTGRIPAHRLRRNWYIALSFVHQCGGLASTP